MQIENHSAYHPTTKLRPLVNWVAKQFPGLKPCKIKVFDAAKGEFSGGMAYKWDPENKGRSLVELCVSNGGKYPVTSYHVEEVGSVTLETWEEEVVFVLGHEIGHIRSFWNPEILTLEQEEVVAEKTAVEVLKRFTE